MKPPRYVVLAASLSGLVSLFSFFGAACGGSTESGTSDATNAGTDGGANTDGTTLGVGDGADGVIGAGGPCPVSPPTSGSACPTKGLGCEYGGEGDHLMCATHAHCREDGTWNVVVGLGQLVCTGAQSENDPACPGTWDPALSGSTCPLLSGNRSWCVYPEGICECTSCGLVDGGFGSGDAKSWSCVGFNPAPSGCPVARPHLGAACSVEGQECDYARVCTSVPVDFPNMKCTNGVWTDEPVEQPPCAYPRCGN